MGGHIRDLCTLYIHLNHQCKLQRHTLYIRVSSHNDSLSKRERGREKRSAVNHYGTTNFSFGTTMIGALRRFAHDNGRTALAPLSHSRASRNSRPRIHTYTHRCVQPARAKRPELYLLIWFQSRLYYQPWESVIADWSAKCNIYIQVYVFVRTRYIMYIIYRYIVRLQLLYESFEMLHMTACVCRQLLCEN